MKIEKEVLKKYILDEVSNVAVQFALADRQDDQDLSFDQLNNAILGETVTIDEIVCRFKNELDGIFRVKLSKSAVLITKESLKEIRDIIWSYNMGLTNELYEVLKSQDLSYIGQYLVNKRSLDISKDLGTKVLVDTKELNIIIKNIKELDIRR